MRWVNFKERSPVKSDTDRNGCVVTRYTIRGEFIHVIEHWTNSGIAYWLPDAVEWLEYSASQIVSDPKVSSHIRKVEL